jgi:oligoendopeptidase F
MFERIDAYFGDCLRVMDELGHLDLDSKTGKAPGGYNYPLYEIGVPFIFMNAVGTQRDLETMVHEGGHAIHSFLSRDLPLTAFKNLPSEVAELASMSMELLSMPQWSEFYNPTDHVRAMREQIEGTLKVLPWIAQIDAFQHWIYENPTHSLTERAAHWQQLATDFGTGLTDWAGYEDLVESAWQRQLHLFEVPFYYIEYGIAQLGALGVWKNSLENYPSAIENYKKALALGYTEPMTKIYETAGVPFDFSSERLQTLASFIQNELKKMN